MIHYFVYNNKGQLIEKTTPDETKFMVVSVFGNAEKISSFDKENHRIWTVEPNNLDTENYKGYYKVQKNEFEEWASFLRLAPLQKREWRYLKMDMSSLEKAVIEAAKVELKRANGYHGPHTSTHQAYGVLKEELEEAEEKKNAVDLQMECIWNDVKKDNFGAIPCRLDWLETHMVKCTAEMIQALAMVYKFKDYLKERR